MSGSARKSAAFSGFTDPPYWTRTPSPAGGPPAETTAIRMKAAASAASTGGRGTAGANGPDWLVRDHERRHLVGRERPEGRLQLGTQSPFGGPGIALLGGLPDAQDRDHRVPEHRPHGRRDLFIGHREEAPALGVADDHVAHTQSGQHRRADLAGERALVIAVAVLRAELERHPLPLDEEPDGPDVGERWVDGHLHQRRVSGLHPQPEVAHGVERHHVVVVHLPVGADERPTARRGA